MQNNRRNDLLRILVGAGLYMLDPVRNVLADRIEDFTGHLQGAYEDVTDRANRVSRTIRGRDHGPRYPGWDNGISLLLGVGVGVGIGMLLAPASGKETRTHLSERAHNIGDKVQGFGDRVKDRFSESKPVTGTYGGV